LFHFSGFQRRVIYLLIEIRDNVKNGIPLNRIVQSGADENTLDQNLTLDDFKNFDLSLNVRKDYDICVSKRKKGKNKCYENFTIKNAIF
jgi:hypothetical protein